MSELLPCPFCGNEALLLGGGEYEGIQQGYTVECHNCSATTAYFGADNMQEAIEAWNKRAERTCERVNKPDQFFADDFGYSVDAYRCSVCNFRLDRITNYCPNCGARVRSEDETS